MDKTQILRAFNDHFQEFMDDVLRVFPNDRELRTVANALGSMRKANPKLMHGVFLERIVRPYRSAIDKGDPNFFVDKNWTDDVSDNQLASKGVVLNKIERMRGSVKRMRGEDQRKSMRYIQNLAKIAELYES
tara:strand:+ start:263 stop:658 length:396 start_codon:yes stop_codon:yes gene_type:complete